eukprot:186181-Hanusia_phi.AAC.1
MSESAGPTSSSSTSTPYSVSAFGNTGSGWNGPFIPSSPYSGGFGNTGGGQPISAAGSFGNTGGGQPLSVSSPFGNTGPSFSSVQPALTNSSNEMVLVEKLKQLKLDKKEELISDLKEVHERLQSDLDQTIQYMQGFQNVFKASITHKQSTIGQWTPSSPSLEKCLKILPRLVLLWQEEEDVVYTTMMMMPNYA